MKAKPIKNYFERYNKVTVVLVATIFTLMLGFSLLSEIFSKSRDFISMQVQASSYKALNETEFISDLNSHGMYSNIQLYPVKRSLNTSMIEGGGLKNRQVITIGDNPYIVTFEHSYFEEVVTKFIVVVVFAIFGAYWVLSIFNKAKINSLTIQLEQLYGSIDKLSNKNVNVVESDVTEFQELQDLLEGVNKDLSSEREVLISKAEVDHLTKVYNRFAFDKKLKELDILVVEERKAIGLLYFDLNNFKPMNDKYGHDFGDQVLIKFATILKASIRADDIAFRLGGDEFAVLVQHGVAEGSVTNLRKMLLSRINKQILILGREIDLSCSIGICVYPFDVSRIDDLLPFADKDMYVQKAISKEGKPVTRILSVCSS